MADPDSLPKKSLDFEGVICLLVSDSSSEIYIRPLLVETNQGC